MNYFCNKNIGIYNKGHFARLVMNLDTTQELKDCIFVEQKDYTFFIYINYEKLLLFCEFCNTLGQSIDKCRKSNGHGRTQCIEDVAVVKMLVKKYAPKNIVTTNKVET